MRTPKSRARLTTSSVNWCQPVRLRPHQQQQPVAALVGGGLELQRRPGHAPQDAVVQVGDGPLAR